MAIFVKRVPTKTKRFVNNDYGYIQETYTGFTIHPEFVSKLDLSLDSLLVFSYIYSFSIKNKWCTSSASIIAKTLNIKERKTVTNILNKLTSSGYLVKEKVNTKFISNNKYQNGVLKEVKYKEVSVNFNKYKCNLEKINLLPKINRSELNKIPFIIEYDMFNKGLKTSELLIYAKIKSSCLNGNSVFYGSFKYLSECCNLSIRTVSRVVDSLLRNGFLKEEAGSFYIPEFIKEYKDLELYKNGITGLVLKIYENKHIFNFETGHFDKITHKYFKKSKLEINNYLLHYQYLTNYGKNMALNERINQNKKEQNFYLNSNFFNNSDYFPSVDVKEKSCALFMHELLRININKSYFDVSGCYDWISNYTHSFIQNKFEFDNRFKEYINESINIFNQSIDLMTIDEKSEILFRSKNYISKIINKIFLIVSSGAYNIKNYNYYFKQVILNYSFDLDFVFS